jgi:alkyl hydroperoxide reductase subunit AhpC
MSIPAQPNYDPDLVIGQALIDEGKLLREWDKVQAVLEAAKKLIDADEALANWEDDEGKLYGAAWDEFRATVLALKEMEAKDETK